MATKPSRPKITNLRPRLATLDTSIARTAYDSDTCNQPKGKTGERGYGWRWQQERRRFLEAHMLCVYCEKAGRVRMASVVDHRIPHRGDMDLFWDKGNWQPLCASCHSSIKQREEGGRYPGGSV